jgi:hypothetical protein
MNASASRAHKAHQRRVTGESWEKIALDLGYATARSVKSSVRRYAKQFDWVWPLDEPVPRKRSHEGIPIAGFDSHPEAAYRLRVQGLKWQEVGARIGLHSPNAHGIVMRYARKYAKRNNLPWPPKLQKEQGTIPEGSEQAYHLRATGLPWVAVGEQSGLGMKARRRAQRYADMAGKPWPVQLPSMAEQAYNMRRDDPTLAWRIIAQQIGYSHSHHACAGARRHATTRAIEWMSLPGQQGHTEAEALALAAVEAVGVLDGVPDALVEVATDILGSV